MASGDGNKSHVAPDFGAGLERIPGYDKSALMRCVLLLLSISKGHISTH